VDEVFVAGGGALNQTLLRMLRARLAPTPVADTTALGIPMEAREVLAMVVLDNDTVQGLPGNAPAATGAVLCADITPGRPG
jgi:anhydro-N-acetylmuramic acid kinase